MKARKFTLSTDPRIRAATVATICDTIADLPDDVPLVVTVSDKPETRRSAQLRLQWAWNGVIGEAIGHSPDYAHALTKLAVLLPLRLTWDDTHDRAVLEQDIMDALSSHKLRVAVAYDAIRSSDLSVARFAEYLSAVQAHYGEQGIVLDSTSDDARHALGARQKEAA